MRVALIFRPEGTGYSFEVLYERIANQLSEQVEVTRFYLEKENSFYGNVQAIKKIEADILHFTGGNGYYAPFVKGNKVLTIHDTNHYEYDLKGIKKLIYSQMFFKWPSKNVKKITTVSAHTKDNLVKLGLDTDHIEVIPNCIAPEYIVSDKKFSTEEPVILQIGDKPNKNIFRLIEALKGIPCKLHIVGRNANKYVDALEKAEIQYILSKDLSNEEMLQAYQNADIISFVSLYEGFGIPIIEGQAVGRPVITSNVSSMPHVAGGAAVLVDPYSVDEIRNGIQKLISDKTYREDLVNKGFENASKYTVDKIAKAYLRCYRSLLL